MATFEVWAASRGSSTTSTAQQTIVEDKSLVYRFNPGTGAPMSGTNPTAQANSYAAQHNGVLLPLSSVAVWAVDGDLIYVLNPANGTTSSIIGAQTQTGNVVARGSGGQFNEGVQHRRHQMYAVGTASSATIAEIWSYDGSTGITRRYNTAGVRLSPDYQLAAGDTLAFVQTS